MALLDVAAMVPAFVSMSHVDRITVLGWYLHTFEGKEWFGTADIRQCYEALNMDVPNVSDVLAKLSLRNPKVLLRRRNQYKLEMRPRSDLDAKYANRPITIAVEKSLAALPSRLTDETKRKYLTEALSCYKSRCFRAAVLMTWSLAYDHLLNWVLTDAGRLAKFNSQLPNKPPFNVGSVVCKREDFEGLTEREVVEICGHKNVNVVSTNLKKILIQNLDRRNMAAHPSTIEITQLNAEDTISSMIENIVLKCT